MSYETRDGKEIKTIAVEISDLTRLINQFSKKLSYDQLGDLDQLEYDIVQSSDVLSVGDQEVE